MANNWFARTTSGANTWAAREYTTSDVGVSPVIGLVRFVGQQSSVSSSTAVGVIDGGGEILGYAEADCSATYDLFGGISQDFVALYQIAFTAAPSAAVLRLVGQPPTTSVSDLGKNQIKNIG